MEKQKKLLLLGGLRYLIPVIEAAHKEGYYVITCDYIPDNIAHKYSDEYHNVSIIDKEAVLKLAQELQIDGIMSFAVDPGVITAAYVQEKMGLPAFGPYKSVEILQNKDKFRDFLRTNGFNVPWSKSYSTLEEAMNMKTHYKLPCIIKPVDSAGSKGVTRLDKLENLEIAIKHAFDYSTSGRVIIEEYLEKDGCSSDTDCFLIDGELMFVSYSAQRFDINAANPYTPSAYSWPSTFSPEQEKYLTSELQRLFHLLQMRTSIFNIETRISNGKPYIMEVTPRGGGNRLSEMLRYATGIDLITACVRGAVGDSINGIEQKTYNGNWAEVILHADNEGIFECIEIDESLINGRIIECDIWVRKGDRVKAFNGANNAIGTLIICFETSNELVAAMSDISKWIKVKILQ